MPILLKASVFLLTLCYPFAVYYGLQGDDNHWLLVLLFLVLGLRWLTSGTGRERQLSVFFAIGLAGIIFFWGYQSGLKFYPVLVNLGLLVTFGSTLFFPPSMIERFARLKEPDLPEQGVVYTRKVTQIWCGFFLVNGCIAAITAIWASNEVWALYNGFIAYILIGLLLAGEWIFRQKIKAQ